MNTAATSRRWWNTCSVSDGRKATKRPCRYRTDGLQSAPENVEDFRHKLWDHLFLISDFALMWTVPTRSRHGTPKARPGATSLSEKISQVQPPWPNLEVVIDKALKEENLKETRLRQCHCLLHETHLQQLAYKELVHDDSIQGELVDHQWRTNWNSPTGHL